MLRGEQGNFIYVLRCPATQDVRYVGKTDSPSRRLKQHIRTAKGGAQHHCARWIRKLLSAGLEPKMEVVRVLTAKDDWQSAEMAEIKLRRGQGCRLTNCTDGGEGATITDPVMAALRNAKVKRALSRPDVKKKIADAIAAHWEGNAAARREMSEKQKAIGCAPLERAVRSARMRRLWASDKERMLASQSTPEFRKAHAERIEKAWADPSVRSRMEEVNRNPQSRKRKSEGAKQRWQDPTQRDMAREKAKARATPEYRAMMAEKTRLSWEKRRANAAIDKLAQQETGE